MALISVVVPMFNEQECLQAMFDRLSAVRKQVGEDFEFIFVDDGSSDGTLQMLRDLSARDPSVRYVSFSRNFGHEAAIIAGLDHASGDAVITMDGDLQHPPEVIPTMIQKWREGYQVVYTQRRKAGHEGFLKKLTSRGFYKIIRRLSDVNIAADAANFRLMDRRVVDQVRRLREYHRFVRGVVSWVGFRQTGIPYDEEERFAGQTKYSLRKSARLAVDAMMSFANFPLRKAVSWGFLACLLSLGAVLFLLVRSLVLWAPVPVMAVLLCGLFFLGGVQLVIAGLAGEYAVRTYRQSQNRPLYVVGEKTPVLPKGDEGWHDTPTRQGSPD